MESGRRIYTEILELLAGNFVVFKKYNPYVVISALVNIVVVILTPIFVLGIEEGPEGRKCFALA